VANRTENDQAVRAVTGASIQPFRSRPMRSLRTGREKLVLLASVMRSIAPIPRARGQDRPQRHAHAKRFKGVNRLQQGELITSINAYRMLTGSGLKEAKNLVQATIAGIKAVRNPDEAASWWSTPAAPSTTVSGTPSTRQCPG
jgi:ribosomal protein L7/L12